MEEQMTTHEQGTMTLDVRPDLARGDEPFARIMEAAASVKSGETLVIIAPFEPVPLYGVLGAQGFAHETRQAAAGEWMVRFVRG
ncbi:MAG TPA: DUF2249 domain-containing protein [Ktedonobacteraceae bacterium]|nr:DUF2249 domain-containing protein [Ktedonobacteraceae bacterium]